MFASYCRMAGMLALVAIAAGAQSGEAERVIENPVIIHGARSYKEMSRRAKTADEFTALSMWCSSQSSIYAKRVTELESELKAYYANPSVGPKYPSRDQSIKERISHYRILSAQWQARANDYNNQVAKLNAGGAKRLDLR
jgi:hypothetical protein